MQMQRPNPTETETFHSTDFWLSGALLAAGRRLLRLDWEGSRAFFVFADSTTCKELAQAYWAGDLRVGAKAFSDALRTLKDRLHGDGRNEYTPKHKS